MEYEKSLCGPSCSWWIKVYNGFGQTGSENETGSYSQVSIIRLGTARILSKP